MLLLIVPELEAILLLHAQVQRATSEELAFQPAARFEPVMQEVRLGYMSKPNTDACHMLLR